MIKTITNLKITKLRELSTLSVDSEYLTIDYLDEDGEEQRIEKLTHEEDLGEYNVKTDLWEDILEDWRLTKPIPVPLPKKKTGNCWKTMFGTSPTRSIKNCRTIAINYTKPTTWRISSAASVVSAT